MATCRRCGTYMNPAERMLGPYCGPCVRKAHFAATHGQSIKRVESIHDWVIGKYTEQGCPDCGLLKLAKFPDGELYCPRGGRR